MKRYWKIISLSVFIVVVFSSYYIGSVIYKDDLPEFELVTLSGDEQVTESFLIFADYMNEPHNQSFKLSSEGMTYLRDISFFERLDGYYRNPTMEKLIDENRQFMRGKDNLMDSYFEDDTVVIRVDPASLTPETMEIEILEKASGKTVEFAVELPNQEKIDHMNVQEVQLLDQNLYVVTSNFHADKEEVYVYEVNIEQESMNHHYSLLEFKTNKYTTNLNPYFDISAQEYWVMRVDHVELDEEHYYEEIVKTEIVVHHLPTRETKTLELPEQLMKAAQGHAGAPLPEGNFSVGKEQMYFFQFTFEAMTLQTYHFEQQKLEDEETITFDENVLIEGIYPKGDYLYVISKAEDIADPTKTIIGIDLANADIFYEGKIQLVGESEQPLYPFEVYDLHAQ